MLDIAETVLKKSLSEGFPVLIIYNGTKEMTQRRIYVRVMDDKYVTAYCVLKKSIRKFKKECILSAVPADTADK